MSNAQNPGQPPWNPQPGSGASPTPGTDWPPPYGTSPPAPPEPPAGYPPPPVPQPGVPTTGFGAGEPPPATSVATNGLAVASLILGIAGCLWITPILAIVFGVIGRRQITRSGGTQRGSGMATAGIVLGSLWVVLFVVSIALGVTGVLDDESAAPSRAEFVRRMSTEIEDDPDFDIDAYPEETMPDVRIVVQDYASCTYDVLQDEDRYLQAVYDDPAADEFSVPGVSQSRVDELDAEHDRVCVKQMERDFEDLDMFAFLSRAAAVGDAVEMGVFAHEEGEIFGHRTGAHVDIVKMVQFRDLEAGLLDQFGAHPLGRRGAVEQAGGRFDQ